MINSFKDLTLLSLIISIFFSVNYSLAKSKGFRLSKNLKNKPKVINLVKNSKRKRVLKIKNFINNYKSKIDRKLKALHLKKNKRIGKKIEIFTEKLLRIKYPVEKGYKILKEIYLIDKNGKLLKVNINGKNRSRRLDFVVLKGKNVIRIIEATTKTANKKYQSLKEMLIRNKFKEIFVKENSTGKLIPIPQNIKIEIIREFDGI